MKVFVFDTETSGLINNHIIPLNRQPEVIEFSGMLVDLDTGEVLNEIDQLIRPIRPISEEITRITGIMPEDLAEKPAFKEVASAIFEAIASAPMVLAHNAAFDTEVLSLEANRLNQKIIWPRIICTVESSIFYRGYRLSLGALYSYLFNEELKEAHRAKMDVINLVRCASEMFRRGDI
jgi:DNA polymerase III epsilon subunit-like protein